MSNHHLQQYLLREQAKRRHSFLDVYKQRHQQEETILAASLNKDQATPGSPPLRRKHHLTCLSSGIRTK